MVSSSDSINNLLKETLVRNSLSEQLQNIGKNNKSSKENIFSQISDRLNVLPTTLNKETLTDLINGKYDITLKEYTDLTTYNTAMSNFFGNNSANSFNNVLNNLLGTNENSWVTARSFVESLREKGITNSGAITMYNAFQSYSLVKNLNNLNNSSFVSAKI